MDDFIAKPLETQQLMNTIAHWLAPSKDNDETVQPAASESKTCLHSNRPSCPSHASQIVDVQQGLKRLNGKQDLFEKSLQIFLKSYHQASAHVQRLLQEDRSEEAAKYCHTMKGAAATICAERLYAVLLSLEREIRNGDQAQNSSTLQAFDRELQRLIDWIQGSSVPEYFKEKAVHD